MTDTRSIDGSADVMAMSAVDLEQDILALRDVALADPALAADVIPLLLPRAVAWGAKLALSGPQGDISAAIEAGRKAGVQQGAKAGAAQGYAAGLAEGRKQAEAAARRSPAPTVVVERDPQGRPLAIVEETADGHLSRRRVERDADGRVIRLVEEVTA